MNNNYLSHFKRSNSTFKYVNLLQLSSLSFFFTFKTLLSHTLKINATANIYFPSFKLALKTFSVSIWIHFLLVKGKARFLSENKRSRKLSGLGRFSLEGPKQEEPNGLPSLSCKSQRNKSRLCPTPSDSSTRETESEPPCWLDRTI